MKLALVRVLVVLSLLSAGALAAEAVNYVKTKVIVNSVLGEIGAGDRPVVTVKFVVVPDTHIQSGNCTVVIREPALQSLFTVGASTNLVLGGK